MPNLVTIGTLISEKEYTQRFLIYLAAGETHRHSSRYDMLKSISYDIYLGQDLGQDHSYVKNLHPPNISWIHDVNKSCLLDLTK